MNLSSSENVKELSLSYSNLSIGGLTLLSSALSCLKDSLPPFYEKGLKYFEGVLRLKFNAYCLDFTIYSISSSP